MIDIFDKKLYRGRFESEESACEFYDKIQINLNGIFVRISNGRQILTSLIQNHKF